MYRGSNFSDWSIWKFMYNTIQFNFSMYGFSNVFTAQLMPISDNKYMYIRQTINLIVILVSLKKNNNI